MDKRDFRTRDSMPIFYISSILLGENVVILRDSSHVYFQVHTVRYQTDEIFIFISVPLLLSETGIRDCEKKDIHENRSSKSSLTFIAYH